MIPVTDSEMAANTTFTSILNEIQLSNLNFTINVTPFAAYITLKKTLQKDLDGTLAVPAPPLLFLLQQSQQQTLELQVENLNLKSIVDNLEKNYDALVQENVSLKESKEEANKVVADLTTTNDILSNKIDAAERDTAKNKGETVELEVKIKEIRKKHASEIKEFKEQVKELKNAIKSRDKEKHDLSRTIENARVTIKNYKEEKSHLKTCKTKLEAEVRKLEKRQHQKQREVQVKTFKSED